LLKTLKPEKILLLKATTKKVMEFDISITAKKYLEIYRA
jgi:hypothetical protein